MHLLWVPAPGSARRLLPLVAFLASDAARWITGRVADASGGLFPGPPLA
ncbi:hypothetical protein ACIGEZ_27650 [Streptomyces sp. NPDC085481]